MRYYVERLGLNARSHVVDRHDGMTVVACREIEDAHLLAQILNHVGRGSSTPTLETVWESIKHARFGSPHD